MCILQPQLSSNVYVIDDKETAIDASQTVRRRPLMQIKEKAAINAS